MSNNNVSGPIEVPESERKFGLTLRADLYLEHDEPINVIILGRNDSGDEGLMESVSKTLSDVEGVSLFGGVMLSATVNPPDVRSKLITIAENDQVGEIIIDEPLMPITIPKSYFR